MFCVELVRERPRTAAPYYCLVVRDAYTVGRLDTSDIHLDKRDISRQHATLQVTAAAAAGEADTGAPAFPTLTLTNYSKHGTVVDGKIIPSSCTLQHGSVVSFGADIDLRVHFRPIFVAISDCYTDEYSHELCSMLSALGATLVPLPVPRAELPGARAMTPLGCFLIAEDIGGGVPALRALAYEYQVVAPAYLFELFGAAAERPAMPLHELPSPAEHEPRRDRAIFGAAHYVPPLPPACPFSLFPLPAAAAVASGSRRGIFGARVLMFRSPAAAEVLGPLVRYCGATVVDSAGETDTEDSGVEALLRGSMTLRYVVLHRVEHRLATEEAVVDPEVARLVQEEGWIAISEECVLAALLGANFRPAAVELPQPPDTPQAGELAEHAAPPRPMSITSASCGAPAAATDITAASEAYFELGSGAASAFDGSSEAGAELLRRLRRRRRGGRDEDSDATPSDISSDDGEEELAAELRAAATEQRFEGAAATRVFAAHFEKIKAAIDRSIAPEAARVDEIIRAARRHRFIAPTTVEFLEGLHERCTAQLRRLEELSTAAHGNRRSAVLQRQWDVCADTQRKIVEAIQLAARVGDASALRSPFWDPHMIPPRPEPEDAGGHAAGAPDGADTAPAAAASSASPSAVRPQTLMLRYFPPAPVRARIHTPPPRKSSQHVDDISNARLLIGIPPRDVFAVGRHRLLFIRRFGKDEGEKRFALWLSTQSPEWATEFNRAIEERDLTLPQLLHEVARRGGPASP